MSCLPLRFLITSSFTNPIPAKFSPSILIILSPEIIPSFSEGPFEMGETTTIVSFIMLNSIPMPLNSPDIFSLTFLYSFFGM